MDKDLEFYLNNQRSTCCNPIKQDKCLIKQKYLSEFSTDEEKEVVRSNLGITEQLKILKDLINTKVIESGNIAWDQFPTKGNLLSVLSSDALYTEFLKYALKTDIDSDISALWQTFNEKLELLSSNVSKLDQKLVNTQQELQQVFKCLIKDKVEEKMEVCHQKYDELKNQLDELKSQFTSYTKNGIAVSQKFGNNTDISISQKTITDAINNLYEKIAEQNGLPTDRISINITPDYFISEEGCTATIHIRTISDTLENIKIYANNELIEDVNGGIDLTTYEREITVTDTTVIKVIATILGQEYQKEETITKYYPFFIGSGQLWENIITPSNSIRFDGNLQGSYQIEVHNTGERFFIIIPKSQQQDIGRIHMNGYDIPFNTIEEDKYVIYASKNTYQSGTYTIYIQNI